MAIIYETEDLHVDEIKTAVDLDFATVDKEVDLHDVMLNDKDGLIIVGPTIPMERAARVAEYYRVLKPEVGVVIARDFVDDTDLKIALTAGARSVVAIKNIIELQQAASNSLALTDEMSLRLGSGKGPKIGRVIAFFGTKGGVGKTMLATNLALALADLDTQNVCIVDLNLGSGDVAVFLNQAEPKNLGLIANTNGRLDEKVIRGLAVRASDQLDAFLSPSHPVIAEKISVERTLELVRELRKNYDFVIIDTSGIFNQLNLSVLRISDDVFTVITPDLPAVKDAVITLDLLEEFGFPRSKRQIILNMNRAGTGLTSKEIEKTLGQKIDYEFPDHPQATRAVNSGWSLIRFQPANPISRRVRRFAQELFAQRNHSAGSEEHVEPEIIAPSSFELGDK